jgi:hypothetical protein
MVVGYRGEKERERKEECLQEIGSPPSIEWLFREKQKREKEGRRGFWLIDCCILSGIDLT